MGIKRAVLTAVFAISTIGFAAQADSLADAMAGAYSHSGLIEQNRALLRAADEDVAQAVAALRPILNWRAGVTNNFSINPSSSSTTSASVGVDLSWTLLDNGAKTLNKARLEQTVLATRQGLVGVEQRVLLAAVDAYMAVRRDTQIVSLRENNLRVITRELRAAEDRFEVGEVTRTDVALAQARLAGARAELAVAQGNLMAAHAAYQAAVGRKPNSLQKPSRLPSAAKSLEAAQAIAVRTHPDMLSAQFRVAAADIGANAALTALRPGINLTAGLTQSHTFDSSTNGLGGQVSITTGGPIYQGGAIASASRQAIALRDAERAGLHATRHNIRLSVGNAWAQLLAARAQREASLRQIEAAQVAFDGVREEAKLGSRTTLDVLNAEQELLNAKSSEITAQSAEFTAAFALQAAMGLLTVDQMNLAVEKYDPEAYYKQVKSAPAMKSKQGRQLDKILRRIENQ